MKFTRDRMVENELYERLRSKYAQPRPEIPHLSELMGCLTKSYWSHDDPITLTDKEAVMFAIGFGLEEVILRDVDPKALDLAKNLVDWVGASHEDIIGSTFCIVCEGEYVENPEALGGGEWVHIRDCPVPIADAIIVKLTSSPIKVDQLDGVFMTIDYVNVIGEGLDLKSTRMYPNKDQSGVPNRGWPDMYLQQFMGYAKLRGQLNYAVAIIYLIPAEMVAGTFEFTQEEVDNNWDYILRRKTQYIQAWVDGKVPLPFTTNQDWECKGCRYYGRCQTYR